MRAAVVNDRRDFEIVDVPDPVPGPGELVLRVDACGICGSDLKAYAAMPPGSVLGHEFCGEVVAVGKDTSGWREGQSVAAMPLASCGHCVWCHTDLPAHCAHADRVGVGGSAGAFAEFVRVDAVSSVALQPGTGRFGALVEPFAVGLHCLAVAAIRSGDRVLVLGGGNVGTAVTLWARRLGAGDVVVSDPAPTRREAAPAFGASAAHDPADGPPTGAFDVVFECVGGPGMVQTAIDAAAPRGRVVVAGVCLGHDRFVPAAALMKEVEIRFAVYYGRKEFATAAALLESGAVDRAGFVSSQVGLDDIGAAFERLLTTSTERKVLVRPNA